MPLGFDVSRPGVGPKGRIRWNLLAKRGFPFLCRGVEGGRGRVVLWKGDGSPAVQFLNLAIGGGGGGFLETLWGGWVRRAGFRSSPPILTPSVYV